MQIAWNEWLFNYFSLVIYYRFGNLFLHLREAGERVAFDDGKPAMIGEVRHAVGVRCSFEFSCE